MKGNETGDSEGLKRSKIGARILVSHVSGRAQVPGCGVQVVHAQESGLGAEAWVNLVHSTCLSRQRNPPAYHCPSPVQSPTSLHNLGVWIPLVVHLYLWTTYQRKSVFK